ncbi:MAG: CMP/dCMP deaminase zinc-binding protein [Bacteroidetes bacterium]|jgi:tRNA(Arg) A34 adenosine deaminase TadA|nr:CMP/dCMP deaminase zinc-binding protein [Bacteroidota bacterium]
MNEPTDYNPAFMQRAVELSELAYKSGKGLPIGCVIVKNGVIVGEGHNEIFSRTNPTAHGEMVAIEDACKQTGDLQLADCDMYTTLEPCPMCLGAIYWAKLRKVYFANTSRDASAVGFDDSFIFREFGLEPQKRQIPMFNTENTGAMKVLREWQSLNSSASQPWQEK